MELIESGESVRGGESEVEEVYVPGALGMPLALENLHFSVSSSSSGEHGFQEARKLNPQFGTDL